MKVATLFRANSVSHYAKSENCGRIQWVAITADKRSAQNATAGPAPTSHLPITPVRLAAAARPKRNLADRALLFHSHADTSEYFHVRRVFTSFGFELAGPRKDARQTIIALVTSIFKYLVLRDS